MLVYIRKLAILHFPIRDLLKHKVDQGCPCSKYPDKLLITFEAQINLNRYFSNIFL